MNLLCFDVAGPVGSIAVFKEGACVKYLENPEKRSHAAKLVPLIEEILDEAGLKYTDLEAIVTCVGPGSFTGIRIGLATAKGLEIATKKPIMGLSAFSVDHWKCKKVHEEKLPVLVAVDALREDVYCQLFNEDGTSEKPVDMAPSKIPAYMGDKKFILTGSAISQVHRALEDSNCELVSFDNTYTARDLGEMVLSLSDGELKELADAPLEPFYLRPPDIGGK